MHALRHFFASVLLDAGESIKAVSAYLGHTDADSPLDVHASDAEQNARTRAAVDGVLGG
jgi:integrase